MTTELERSQALLAYYRANRADKQRTYYKRKSHRLRARDTRLRVAAGLLMLSVFPLSTLANILQGGADGSARVIWGVALAVVPALSTALVTLRNLTQYQSFQHLYRRTFLNLDEVADHFEPGSNAPDLPDRLKEYILKVEQAIADENVEWRAQGVRMRVAEAPGEVTPGEE